MKAGRGVLRTPVSTKCTHNVVGQITYVSGPRGPNKPAFLRLRYAAFMTYAIHVCVGPGNSVERDGPPMSESCLKTYGAIENGIYRAWRSMRNGILEVRNCHFTRVVHLGTFDSQSTP